MPETVTEDAGCRFAFAPGPEPVGDALHRVFVIFVRSPTGACDRPAPT